MGCGEGVVGVSGGTGAAGDGAGNTTMQFKIATGPARDCSRC